MNLIVDFLNQQLLLPGDEVSLSIDRWARSWRVASPARGAWPGLRSLV